MNRSVALNVFLLTIATNMEPETGKIKELAPNFISNAL